LSTTRPSDPFTLHEDVVELKGQAEGQPIVLTMGTQINPDDKGLMVTSEADLKEAGTTYTFKFDSSALMVLMRGSDQMLMIQELKDIFTYIHLQGLPNDYFEWGASGRTDLVIEKKK
jgi:hypothetical protein